MKTIAKRIKTGAYKTLKQMESDLALMTENAKRYNDPKSIIYKDACKLKRLARDTCQMLSKLMQQGKPLHDTETEKETTSSEQKAKLVEQLSELTQAEFTKKLAEAEAEAEAIASLSAAAAAAASAGETTVTRPKKEAKPNDSDNEDDDDDEEEEDETDDEEDEEEDEEEEGGGAKKEAVDFNGLKTIPTLCGRRNHPLMLAMWSMYDYLKEIKNEADLALIDPFCKLPSKRVYPDYFEEIKQPISYNQIRMKLHKRKYASLNALNRDIALMFNNAMQYNVEESQIYAYAKTLMAAFKQKSAELALTDVGDLVVMDKIVGEIAGANANANVAAMMMMSAATPSKMKKVVDTSLLAPPIKKISSYDVSVNIFFSGQF